MNSLATTPYTMISSKMDTVELISYILDDRLSPILREYFSSTLSINSISVLQKLFEKAVKEYRNIVDKHKPIFIPPKLMKGLGVDSYYVDEPLIPEEIGCWVNYDKDYVYLTYWYRFPYDIWPGDGVEYEPWTIVLKHEDNTIVEYQTRSHWRIVHIHPKVVLHLDHRPIIAFTDHAHTPVPILDFKAISELLGTSLDEVLDRVEVFIDEIIGFVGDRKPILVEKLSKQKPQEYSELEDYVSMKRYARCLLEGIRKFYEEGSSIIEVDYNVLVHIGPSRRKPPPHNPLKEKWYSRPVFH